MSIFCPEPIAAHVAAENALCFTLAAAPIVRLETRV